MTFTRLTRSRARGAAYVEVLVIVGIVLVLGLLAVNLLGTSSSEQAGKEAECIKSFGCGAGGARGGSQPVATMVGAPATPGPRTEAAALRAAVDAASRRLADAEDREAEASRRMTEAMRERGNYRNRPSPAVVAARTQLTEAQRARREADAAYTAAGQRLLDRAYGGSYGFFARNWIDLQNTGPFLGGLAVGTWNGVLNTPHDIAELAGRGWEWANGRSPPPDAAAEREARIRERREYVENELLRVSGPAGASAANYGDGVYDGQHIVAGVVVGEGAGLLIKGGVSAVRVIRGSEPVRDAAGAVPGAAGAPRAAEPVPGAAPRPAEPGAPGAAPRAAGRVDPRDPRGIAADGTVPVYKPGYDQGSYIGHVPAERALTPDTIVYRVQPADKAMMPHVSDYFDPIEYGLRSDTYWDALYVSTNRAELEALRARQGYFAAGDTIQEARLGDLMTQSGPGTFVMQDTKFNMSVLGADSTGADQVGAYIITRPRAPTP